MKNYIWKNLLIGFLFMLQACSKNEIVSIVDSRVLSIPIQKSHEPLLDLREQSTILFGPSPEIPNNFDYIKLEWDSVVVLFPLNRTFPNRFGRYGYSGSQAHFPSL